MSNLIQLLHVWLIENNPSEDITYFIPQAHVEVARNAQVNNFFGKNDFLVQTKKIGDFVFRIPARNVGQGIFDEQKSDA